MFSADATSGLSADSQDTLLIKDTSTDVSKIAHMYSTMKGGGLDLSTVFMNGCLTTGTCHIA